MSNAAGAVSESNSVPSRPPRQTSSNVGRILGAMGVVLLVSTPLTYLLTLDFGPLILGKLIVGVLFIGVYLSTNASFFARMAGSRSTGLLAVSALTVAVVIFLVAVANYLAYRHPKELDLTREGLYTLSKQTSDLLGRLSTDVKVVAFFSNYDPAYPEVQETLSRYGHQTKKLSFEILDPQSRPDLVEKYAITENGPRIVVTSESREARAKDPSEQELTNAIIRVSEQTTKTVYFLTGHGEGDIEESTAPEGYKALADAIGAEGYEVEPLSLLQSAAATQMGLSVKLTPETQGQGGAGSGNGKRANEGNIDAGSTGAPEVDDGLQIPADAGALVIGGARSKLFEPEVAAIEAYLNRGGRVLIMIDPNIESGLSGLLRQWKIGARDDLVVDPNPVNRLLGLGVAAPMVQPTEMEHVITSDLVAPAVMMTARSLEILAGGEAGVDTQSLVGTGVTAWGETRINPRDGSAEFDDADAEGPLDVAMVATRRYDAPDPEKLSDEGRLIVFADSDWVSNKYLTMQGNSDLILNSINWLAEQEEKISIRPKMRAASQLFLSVDDLGRLKFFSMDILPVLLVAMGFGIVLIRRQK